MSTTAVRSPTEYESQLQRYLFERSEEGRAVRVGDVRLIDEHDDRKQRAKKSRTKKQRSGYQEP